jgi:hypothetical protein
MKDIIITVTILTLAVAALIGAGLYYKSIAIPLTLAIASTIVTILWQRHENKGGHHHDGQS